MKSKSLKFAMSVFFAAALVAFFSFDGYAQDEGDGGDESPAAPAAAQGSGAKKKPIKKSVSFEDQLVEGDVQKPELFYLLQKKQFNYGRLIKLRENFIPEMRRTAEDIQR